MKALTIWQPWASLIMAGAKPYEYRRWSPPRRNIGQRIIIHAGARKIRAAEVELLEYRLATEPETTGLDPALALVVLRHPENLPLASGLGTALLGNPRRAAEIHAEIADSDRINEHVWGWPLSDIESFAPMVPARGAQGLWNWSLTR